MIPPPPPQAKLVGALKEYRMLVGAASRQPNALVYPEQLRFLAAHTLGLMKCSALRWGPAGAGGEPQEGRSSHLGGSNLPAARHPGT
jgi:hypothetical protein